LNFGVKVGRFANAMSSSRIDSILRSVHALEEPIYIHGAVPIARALTLAEWACTTDKPLVVLCATDDAAAELASDLEVLAATILNKAVSVYQLPSWEQSPYNAIAPSIRSRLARMTTLGALLGPTWEMRSGGRVFVTTLAASYQASIPEDFFARTSITLETNNSIGSREALVSKLIEGGYLRVDPVEDPGTFAVRGDIVDIFPVNRARPIRIELFDDIIERVREFNPATQRANVAISDPVERFFIPPAREALINHETTVIVRERLKARADDSGIHRNIRDPILEATQEGTYPDHSDAWAPFAYQHPSTLWDHVPKTWPVVWADPDACLTEWGRFFEEQKQLSQGAGASGIILPSAEELFRWSSEREQNITQRSRLYFERFESADLAEPPPEGLTGKHSVVSYTNSDLAAGTRRSLGELEPKLQLWLKQGFKILVLSSTKSQVERVRFLLEERQIPCLTAAGDPRPGAITLRVGSLSEGFRWPAEGLVVLTEGEVLGANHMRKQRRPNIGESGSAAKNWSGLQALSDLSVGDLVVHLDHGIGRYIGLVRLDLLGAPSDFLLVEYANKDKLYLPIYRLNVIQKYIGSGGDAALDRLGSQQFAKAKERVRGAVRKLAVDLVHLYAERSIRPGVRISPADAMFREFEARFPFDETPDQLKAIDDTMADLESGRVMDRLICGDVGYGKTEVAIRAAFRVVSEGKQVAILVPTTILAHQHEQSFKSRLKNYPITVESISRFKSTKEQRAVLRGLAAGSVDIIIGTHRLLSRDVQFRDLGLLVIDEEHRFGVEHKEKLKALKVNTHVLALTATPIPRTLHMALSGLRDISIMNTPPIDRLPIRTYVSKFDETLIKRAINLELSRGGQVFFLYNRVQSIFEFARNVHQWVPQAQVGVAHGQMSEVVLERAMISFYQKKTNVLVCTSIIESGLDLPSANTIIVDRADRFGLAQLYQIRGRVGRSQERAYAYLMIPASGGAITEEAKRRLEVIQRFVELGSGFSVASHDLELRGGGDLLGPNQSGFITAVGFDLYTELLEEAIQALRGKPPTPEESRREPEIKIPFPAYLSEDYVPDVHQRLSLYRRFSAAADDAELGLLEEELGDRFGEPPPEAQNLVWLIRIKQLLKKVGIGGLTVGPERISLIPGGPSRLEPARAIALVSTRPDDFQLTPDSRLVAKIPTDSLRDLFFSLESLFQELLPRT
jgi:transcription-repair coupling factor (superfamily II helicase)